MITLIGQATVAFQSTPGTFEKRIRKKPLADKTPEADLPPTAETGGAIEVRKIDPPQPDPFSRNEKPRDIRGEGTLLEEIKKRGGP